nr:glutamate racemase [uncultured Flavobacterium sp.]
MKNDYPIGLFDSGIGGTSIWHEIHSILPNENTIYLADSKNAPYGQKSKDEIIHLSEKNVEFLLNRNSKIIVVACNTATTNAIDFLREKYDVPFIGIEPAIKPAAIESKTGVIGVLATKGTITSELFEKSVKSFKNVEVIDQIGYNLVSLIESGKINSEETENLLKEYILPMVDKDIDHLVLGCTHYPYLTPIIKQFIPNEVKIIDSGEAVAKQTKNILEKLNLLNQTQGKVTNEFFINTDAKVLKTFLPGIDSVFELDF